MRITTLLPTALVVALSGAPALAATSFTCGPAPAHEPKADAILSEAITSSRIATGSTGTLRQAVRRLRDDGVSNGVIVDHAVAAYCPLVAGDARLSIEQKREAVRRFAAELMAFVYEPGADDEAIIVSLPVKPGLSERIDAAAAKSDETRDAWIRQAIEARLAGQ